MEPPNSPLRLTTQLEPRHFVQLAALYRETWPDIVREPESLRKMASHSQRVVGLLDPEGNLCGFARALTDFTYKLLIFDVMVTQARQGQGWGTFLLRSLIEDPDLQQVEHVELYCPRDRVSYYRQFGFDIQDSQIAFMRCARKGSF